MSTRFIADLHLYDTYSLGWRSELGLTLDEFSSMLITNWNSVTKDEDIVILAGDVGRYCPMSVNVVKQLKGIKILVVGNHDLQWGHTIYDSKYFAGTHETILTNGIFVTHKPVIPTDVRRKATYIVHGHHHRYDAPKMQQCLQDYVRDVYRYNCAADLIGFKPRTLQELMLQKELLLEKYKNMNLI